jgi:hypothetical protein
VQLFQAHSSTPVGLITQKGDPPEKLPSLKSKLQFVIGVNHFCTARQLWPAKKRFHEVSGAGLGAGTYGDGFPKSGDTLFSRTRR